MRRRAAKWLCLITLTGGTLFVSCPAGAIALEFLDSALQGAYGAASQWGSQTFRDAISALEDLSNTDGE